MKRILYSNGSLVTGDEMAHAIAMYATSLARVGGAAAVRIPVMENGEPGIVEILIGPASQLLIEDAGPEQDAQFEAGHYLSQIDQARALLDNPPAVQPVPRAPDGPQPLDDF